MVTTPTRDDPTEPSKMHASQDQPQQQDEVNKDQTNSVHSNESVQSYGFTESEPSDEFGPILPPSPPPRAMSPEEAASLQQWSPWPVYHPQEVERRVEPSPRDAQIRLMNQNRFILLTFQQVQFEPIPPNGYPLGILVLYHLQSRTQLLSPVYLDTSPQQVSILGVATSYSSLNQIGVRPNHYREHSQETIESMLITTGRPLLVNLVLFDPQMLNQLQGQKYPFPMGSHLDSVPCVPPPPAQYPQGQVYYERQSPPPSSPGGGKYGGGRPSGGSYDRNPGSGGYGHGR